MDPLWGMLSPPPLTQKKPEGQREEINVVKLPQRERKGQWPRGGAEVAPVAQGRGWQAGTSSSGSSEYCAALSCERITTLTRVPSPDCCPLSLLAGLTNTALAVPH